MNQSKHTPGPLEVRYYRPTPAFLSIPEHVCAALADGTPVAICGPTGDERSEADARLYAAASDLLAACEALLSSCLTPSEIRLLLVMTNAHTNKDGGRAVFDQADRITSAFEAGRAALAKARGEEVPQ